MSKTNEKFYPNILDDFKKALINKGMSQSEFDPGVTRSHINNVAAGRSQNKQLRRRIERFTKKNGD